MSTPEQIGTVEILRTRNYPLDPEAPDGGTDVLVEPGTFPLHREGPAYFWMMRGQINAGGVRRFGDGLFVMTPGDVPSGIEVTFPSRRLGQDQFSDLLAEPVCTEGHPEQRLRIVLTGQDA